MSPPSSKKKSAAKAKRTKSPKAKKTKVRRKKDDVEYQKQRWNAYTSMLLISVLAIVIAITCLWLNLESYDFDIDAKKARDAARALD